MDESSLIIDLANVFTGFDGKPVLKGVSLQVAKGDAVVIEGVTGAGKTTLVRLLLGALPVKSGLARVLDTDLAHADKNALTHLRRKIGVVFQTPRFLDQESVLTNVAVPLAIAGQPSSRRRTEGTRALMDSQLYGSFRKRPSQLSGGEQARLQIARALIHKPFLLIADEPFAHLDPDSAEEAENLLEIAHKRGATLLMTTHRPTRLAEHARRLRLEGGILV
jgi:ABC-type ATPase involved in cell division